VAATVNQLYASKFAIFFEINAIVSFGTVCIAIKSYACLKFFGEILKIGMYISHGLFLQNDAMYVPYPANVKENKK
jgi:hypothetical protein